MKAVKILLTITFFVLSVSYSFAQTSAPGNIKLLDGYTHERGRGIDSSVGNISKTGGIAIRYDIGRMAGNYASRYALDKKNVEWAKTQTVNNQTLEIVYLKDGNIYASFPATYANFMAPVKTNEELTDFLLMVTTYNPEPKK